MTLSSSSAAPPARARSLQYLNEIGLLIVIVILYLVFWSSARGFLSMNNQLSILRGHDPDRPPHLNKVTETV